MNEEDLVSNERSLNMFFQPVEEIAPLRSEELTTILLSFGLTAEYDPVVR